MSYAQGFYSNNIYKYVFNSEKDAAKVMRRGLKMDEAHRSVVCNEVRFQIYEGLQNVETNKSADYINMILYYKDSLGISSDEDNISFSVDTSYDFNKDAKYYVTECSGQQIMFLDHKEAKCLVRARALVDGKIEVVYMFYEKY